jgi:cell shape-determining protein MreD
MIWFLVIVTILFYFLALFQHTFLTHYSLMGVVPNLVFILFFLLVFFETKHSYSKVLFYSVIAGFILDIFSSIYFGESIVILIVIGFMTKRIQGTLKNIGDGYPFRYFLPLFFVLILFYDALLGSLISSNFLPTIIYNLIIASIFFWTYKKYIFPKVNNRQLKLFK